MTTEDIDTNPPAGGPSVNDVVTEEHTKIDRGAVEGKGTSLEVVSDTGVAKRDGDDMDVDEAHGGGGIGNSASEGKRLRIDENLDPIRSTENDVDDPELPAESPQAPTPTPDTKQLNVSDALSYLDAVKQQFVDRPDVYNHFLDIMKDFKSQLIDTPGVIERVSTLFAGHPSLIQGFNTFLPVGYHIECNVDAHETNVITVTTPFGTTTQSQSSIPPMLLPAPASVVTVSSLLDSNVHAQAEGLPYTPEQISPAMEYVTKIKQRFADHTDLYQEFLDILNLYKRSPVDEAQLATRIAKLFQNSPDLLSDFQIFMPRGILPAPEFLREFDGPATVDRIEKGAKHGKKKAGESSSASASVPVAQKRKRKPADREREKEERERELELVRERERGREREREKEREMKLAQNKAKKQKLQQTVHDAPYQQYAPPSPSSRGYALPVHQPPPHSSHSQYEVPPSSVPSSSKDDTLFFDRVRIYVGSRETYDEFLKLVNLFTQDIIDMRRLVEQSRSFLGEELWTQFKEILGWDLNWEVPPHGSIGMSGHNGYLERMERPTREELRIRNGPSYRRLPTSEANVACSGRDEMCKSVLNDEWVSHPTWASEDSGFIPHKKNAYEEALHRSEEERHEYDFHIEAIMRTIAMLEPFNMKIMQLPPEERASYKQKMNFTGVNKSIHQRIIKKVYGREAGLEVIQAIHDSPSIAIPIVLARLKQKEEEWKKAQREWNKVWREVDARNYQKSLDHQGITFKATDKKALTTKAFVNQIESAREEQLAKRASFIDPLFTRTRPRYQMAFTIADMSIVQDLLKLTFSFLDRLSHSVIVAERRRIEGFLRHFVPMLFSIDSVAFNAAFKTRNETRDNEFFLGDDFTSLLESDEPAPVTGSSRSGRNGRRGGANDLRKKILKSAQDKASSRKTRGNGGNTSSTPASRLASPTPTDGMVLDQSGPSSLTNENENMKLPILESISTAETPEKRPPRRGSFFTNVNLYALVRLIEVLYSRLSTFKVLAAKLASDPSSPYLSNPLASDLALLDTEAPEMRLAELKKGPNPAAHFYDHLLESCERLFDGEIDQQILEDTARYMFGTKAYLMFTVDKVISSIVKQVQTIISDNKSLVLLEGLKRERSLPTPTSQDQDDIRANAEKVIGPDENLFRVDWVPETHTVTIQLLGKDDASFDDYDVFSGRWQAYIDSFVSDERTRALPIEKVKPPFLTRNLRVVAKNPTSEEFCSRSGLEIKVCVRTYRMFFVSNTEDFLWREWSATDLEDVVRRANLRTSSSTRWLERLDKEGTILRWGSPK